MSASPVSPELLDHVIAYAQQLDPADKAPASRHVDKLIVFCDNFFLQFFQNHLKEPITAVGAASKAQAIRVRLQPRKVPLPESTIALIKWFERLCDIEPDVKALSYDEDDSPALPDFVLTYVPTLLARALAWATVQQLAELSAKITQAQRIYGDAVRTLTL